MNRRTFFGWFSSVLALAGVKHLDAVASDSGVDATYELAPNLNPDPISCERVFVNGTCVASGGGLSVHHGMRCRGDIGESLGVRVIVTTANNSTQIYFGQSVPDGFSVYTNASPDTKSMEDLHFVVCPLRAPRPTDWYSRYSLGLSDVAKLCNLSLDDLILYLMKNRWIYRLNESSPWLACNDKIERRLLEVRMVRIGDKASVVVMVTAKGQRMLRGVAYDLDL